MNKELVPKKEDQGTPAPAEEQKQDAGAPAPTEPAPTPVQGSNEEKKAEEEEKKEEQQAQGDDQAPTPTDQAPQPTDQPAKTDASAPQPTGQPAKEEAYEKNKVSDPSKMPDRTPANAAARGQFLKKEYVERYKNAKAKDEADLQALRDKIAGGSQQGKPGPQGQGGQGGQAAQTGMAEGTSDSAGLQKADAVMDALGTTAGHITDIGNIVSDSLDVGGVDSSFGDIFGAATGGVNAVFHGYGTVRSIMSAKQNKQNGNKVGAKSAAFESIGGALSTMGDIATMGAGLGGALGGSDNSGNIGNVVAGSLGTLGAISSLAGSSYRTQKYRSGRDALNSKKLTDNDTMFKTSKGNIDSARKLVGKTTNSATMQMYDNARRQRAGLKARRFAAGMAADKAHMNYKAAGWDTLGNVAGMLSGLNSIGAGIAGLAGSNIAKLVKTCIGAVLNVVSTVAKTKNAASAKLRGSQNRDKHIGEYLDAKKAALKKTADAQITDKEKQLTDGELENIIIARLGVDDAEPIAAASVRDQKKDSIFDKLCEKRARYIDEADEQTRTELLTAMGLDPKTATMAAVKEALGG